MPIDYGSDIAGLDDLDPFFQTRSGGDQVRESIARRFLTPSDGENGYDLREWWGEVIDEESLSRLRSDVEAECLKEERVEDVKVFTAFDPRDRSLRIWVKPEGAFETFTLVFRLSDTDLTVLPEP